MNLLVCGLFVAALFYVNAFGATLVISGAVVYFLGLLWLT